jgi:hypothetical protein
VSKFQKPVGQGRFAVVDMRYDAEISNVFHRGRKNRKKMPSLLRISKRISLILQSEKEHCL